jgi:hypothetical protein
MVLVMDMNILQVYPLRFEFSMTSDDMMQGKQGNQSTRFDQIKLPG